MESGLDRRTEGWAARRENVGVGKCDGLVAVDDGLGRASGRFQESMTSGVEGHTVDGERGGWVDRVLAARNVPEKEGRMGCVEDGRDRLTRGEDRKQRPVGSATYRSASIGRTSEYAMDVREFEIDRDRAGRFAGVVCKGKDGFEEEEDSTAQQGMKDEGECLKRERRKECSSQYRSTRYDKEGDGLEEDDPALSAVRSKSGWC
jgi:hypothetical protein